MTKAVGAALVPEILAQSPPAVKVGAGIFVWRAADIVSGIRWAIQ